jgi:hypothetical protein
MTKEQVLQKIKEILAKDKRFVGGIIEVNFIDKKSRKTHLNPIPKNKDSNFK